MGKASVIFEQTSVMLRAFFCENAGYIYTESNMTEIRN